MASRDAEGLGCRDLTVAVGVLLGVAAVLVGVGLGIILGPSPEGLTERVGLTLFAAGAPVSGLFAALAGDLPFTIYLDVIVWVLVGAAVVKLTARGRRLWVMIVIVEAVAIIYGLGISSLVELST